MTMLFYRLLIAPSAVFLLPVLALFNEKVRRGLRMRMQPPPRPEMTGAPLWIHASSGEFEYAKTVILAAKKRWPELPIAVTYFSPTYADAIRKFDLIDYSCPLPLDLPGPCATLIRRLKPKALLIARTDLWPELLTQARRMNVPTAVFSYTQKPIHGRLKRWLTKWRLSHVDRIFCVSEADRIALEEMGVEAEEMGDTRYDQVALRLSRPKPLPENLRPIHPTLIVGSSWSEDEKVVCDGLKDLLRERKLQLVLVPHEPTPQHVNELRRQLEVDGLSCVLLSEGQLWTDKNALIVDKIGILAELYTWGDIAVIGGSFRGSVHSVMEAVGAGLITIVGPYHLNNREAIEFQTVLVNGGWPVVKKVFDATELKAYVTSIIDNPNELKTTRSLIRAEFARKLGASARLLDSIETVLVSSKTGALPRGGGESPRP